MPGGAGAHGGHGGHGAHGTAPGHGATRNPPTSAVKAPPVKTARFKGTDEERKAYYEIVEKLPEMADRTAFKNSFKTLIIPDLIPKTRREIR